MSRAVSRSRSRGSAGHDEDGYAGSTQPSTDDRGAAEEVAERPALAPNLELSGAMQDGAFTDQQWIVQRDGRFIQLTELLYRTLEQINGQRTLDEIAAEVSQASNRGVSAANVRQLIGSKLIPLGLVLRADGTVAENAAKGPRSPLAVKMKTARVDARYVAPVADALKFLFYPPVLVLVLIAAAVAEIWLFFVHGLAGGASEILYSPGLMLAVLGIIVLGTVFHEFGHAAALHYGGGQVRGMGAGLYLIYPAFYTDVTDNYRLGRWARVRTDLGGFYFNLIFALGMIGLYFLTGQEFLLIIVLLINLEIIHQCLPFVRLDGYWALADLTGIPDFFSQMGPFIRSVIPIKGWQGRKLPNLKTWVKLVFALYVVITIPLLTILLFLMVKGVPRILATAWDSFSKLADQLGSARAAGDLLGMLYAVAQIALLALPTLGTIYVLYSFGRHLFTRLWSWSAPTPARRAVGSLATIASVVLLGYLWAPQLPLGGDKPGPLYAQAEQRFRPIQPKERGTVPQALPVFSFRGSDNPASSVTPTPSAINNPSGAGTPAAPAGVPERTPTPLPTPMPELTPSPTQPSQGVPTPTPPSTRPTPTTPVSPGNAPVLTPTPAARTTPTTEPDMTTPTPTRTVEPILTPTRSP